MAHKKIQSTLRERQGQSPKIQKLNKIVIIDDSDVDLFINEALLKEISLTKEVHREISPSSVIDRLKTTDRLSDVPDLIFLDLKMEDIAGFRFLEEFSKLSDFIRDKCKIVVISGIEKNNEKSRLLLNPNVIKYLVKPLDAFQIKEILTPTH